MKSGCSIQVECSFVLDPVWRLAILDFRFNLKLMP